MHKTLQKNCFTKKFKLYRNHCVTISYLERKIFLKFFLKKIKKTQKNVWEVINGITNNNKNTKITKISLYKNNVTTTDDKAIANHFNKFFT